MKLHLMFSGYRPDWKSTLFHIVEKINPNSVHVHIDKLIESDLPSNYKFTCSDQLGKRKYTQVVSTLFENCRNVEADYYLFCQDDIEFIDTNFNFNISDYYAINLIKEVMNQRIGWTDNQEIHSENSEINKIGWIDCISFICSKQALDKIDYKVPDYSIERWNKNPDLSSGVGLYLSRQWKDKIYQVKTSKVKHDINVSVMNNRKQLIAYPTSENVVGIMTTMKSRSSTLKHIINSLAGQIHKLHIYSDYVIDDLPDWVELNIGENIGDKGRWKLNNPLKGYVFVLDDDIIYPKDYSFKMIYFLNYCKKYDKSSVVSVHGRNFITKEYSDYYRDTHVIHFKKRLDVIKKVDFIGSGTLLYNTEDFDPQLSDFRYTNMSDIHIGVLLQQQKINAYLIPRNSNWLKGLNFPSSIFRKRHLYKKNYDNLIKQNWKF